LSLTLSLSLSLSLSLIYYSFYFVSNTQRRLAAQNQERRKSKVGFLRTSMSCLYIAYFSYNGLPTIQMLWSLQLFDFSVTLFTAFFFFPHSNAS
jgi:hypothetical protein